MSLEAVFAATVAFVNLLIGFFINALWQAVKDLQRMDRTLADRMAAMEVLVAGSYVSKEDFERTVEKIIQKLDKIEDKLDGNYTQRGNS